MLCKNKFSNPDIEYKHVFDSLDSSCIDDDIWLYVYI